MKYVSGPKEQDCVFCRVLAEDKDAANYILLRGRGAAVMLNLYPYTNGHLLVVPYQHTGDLTALDASTAAEMMMLARRGLIWLKHSMNPHGFNVGLNLGQAAGAGIEEHVHIHVVPRWENDTNFMPVLGGVRVIPQSLDDTYAMLLKACHEIEGDDQR
jgi:ATP adenylyltransferase